ncbi:threonylcarbamoyl-AMP synthase [Enterovibrio norvegicus FF-33]|uniref:Threonylcarbamoyl-AMP synthase n=1 Tax=Enterovibrio norvegicus FF-454 TaxID=1185651 RepID=A0A1E5C250_9GAMM|nr:L-threonylcarbamoyladenylate synthase [Enterovibrio norvegicus]OEE59586.1 threonylcarbamoyl-AMP synthase [Enterovibrio norvegicus FF-454]OEE69260.1 threonylcarbamoyl-AMP synthase [Enterovibrio norvegicus FF-33]OEE88737.1 threonylcarbamoyl-AMP synthase [Enterovibrio norvegicus FF-162]
MANVEQCVAALARGEVIAYPTEGVFGVGCDPDNVQAVQALLSVKERIKAKGLILIAANLAQLDGYIDLDALSDSVKADVLATWPGPVTWVMPAGKNITDWVTGQFDTVAVRVSDHPDVQALCVAYGKPITSTSANLSGKEPCRTVEEVVNQLGDRVPCVLNGIIGGRDKPTEIRDARSGKVLRQG